MTSSRITVRVTPRAARNSIDGWSDGGVLRVRVTAVPADGKANTAVLRLIAKTLGLPARDVRVVSGQTARTKILEIDGLQLDTIREDLQVSGEAGAS